MISLKRMVFSPFMENTFILYDETNECVIVDPGCESLDEKMELESFIKENKLKPVQVINTHCHVDHVFGNSFVREKYKVELTIHEEELPILERVEGQGMIFGLEIESQKAPENTLHGDEEIRFGNSAIQVIHSPGHSPGSIALYSIQDRFLIAGDVLFKRSIGRSDLPGGNHDTLINSIKKKLLVLDDDVVVFPGHGDSTTIGEERRTNPFLQ